MVKQGNYDITVYRGDSVQLDLVFTDIDNTTGIEAPFDLSLVNVSCQCRYTFNDAQVWLDMAPVIVDAALGQIQIAITAGMSAGLVDPMMGGPVTGFYDLQFTSKTNAAEVFTPLTGKFQVILDVTR